MNAPYPTPNACYTDIKQGILSYTLPLRPDLSDIPGPPISLLPTPPATLVPIAHDKSSPSASTGQQKKKRRAYVNESEEARARRLARNAERMRQKRANETEEEYRLRLAKNAESNRRKRQNETDLERTIRHARSAARERLRRAMETPEQRAVRLAKLAERMRIARANETPDQRAIRLAKNAAKAKERLLKESPEQWIERKRKKAEYARRKRSGNPNSSAGSSSSNDAAIHSALASPELSYGHSYVPDLGHGVPPDVKDIKLIASPKQTGSSQQPEQIYSTPHLPFMGHEVKASEFLPGAGPQQHPGHPDLSCPNNLLKFHVLPYALPPGAAPPVPAGPVRNVQGEPRRNMNGFFQINTYYNEFKQEADAAYVAAPIPQTSQQHQQPPQQQQQIVLTDASIASIHSRKQQPSPSKNQRRFVHESDEAREKRLARNAERMRQKRAAESEEQSRKRMADNAERMRRKRAAETEEEYRMRMERNAAFKMTDEYRRRLTENAERNRLRRQNETELERTIRRARSAARERLRRAMETPEQRAIRLAKLAERMRLTRERQWTSGETPEQRAERLAKLAERMRIARANETPEQRALRLAKNAARARQRFLNESPEQWIERKRKKAEYARQKRSAAAIMNSAGYGSVPSSTSTTTPANNHASQASASLQQPGATTISFPGHAPATLPETILHTSGPQPSSSSASGSSGSKQTKHPPSSAHTEHIYAAPQVIFGSGGDFKPHELLNGQHLVMQGDPNCPSNLYKLHILPYPFPTSAASGGTPHIDQPGGYKTKQYTTVPMRNCSHYSQQVSVIFSSSCDFKPHDLPNGQHLVLNPYYNDIKQEIVVPYAAAQTPVVASTLPQAVHNSSGAQLQSLQSASLGTGVDRSLSISDPHSLTKSQRRFLHESPEARAKRLARNAERMRQKRAAESEDEYRKRMAQNAERMRKKRAAETEDEYRNRMQRNAESKSSEEYQIRLAKNAERNRMRRQNETDLERSIRRARSAARERLRRAMETPEQRAIRLAKLAERMRIARANETPEQRALRLAKNAAKAKERLLNETPEQWIERKRKKAEYARQKRGAAAAAAKLGISTNSCSSNASTGTSLSVPSSVQGGTGTVSFSHAPTVTSTYNLEPPATSHSLSQASLVSLSTADLKDIKLITAQKPGQLLQLPEQLYATPHIPFNGADLKPPEFLTSNSGGGGTGSHQGGPPHHIMQPELYKFHILPYTFSPTAGAVHPTQAQDYKGK
uniref:STPR domain-containing protein n=1 Tax=Anopheles epiroticus TaxID=199890 RepID=A0A182PSP7_9DIPT